MKLPNKILTVAFSILAVLGFSVSAHAYTIWTPITDVTITSPNDNTTVYAGKTYTDFFACTTSTDSDCDGSTPVSDTVTHTWSGPGTFDPTIGTSGIDWTTPAAAGDVNITVTADDSPLADDTAKTDIVTVTVVYDKAFSVLDSSDNNIAIFDNLGNLFLKGTMDQNSVHSATAVDEFRFQDSDSNDVAIIDANDGNMYIDGQVFESQGTLTPSGTNNFIIEDSSGNTVAYIDDPNGDLYLKGSLYEQVF